MINNNEASDCIVGLYLWVSEENEIKDNIISSNSLHGIDLRNSNYNIIYNNRLLNLQNAYDIGNNYWNITKDKGINILGGPYIGGNFWNDFSGIDLNLDGIIDSAKSISGGKNKDYYPLRSYDNYAPYPPLSPIPFDGSTKVDLNKDLVWNCGDPDFGDVLTYDVYFGLTNPPPKVISKQSDSKYDPGLLAEDTRYYWKIVAYDIKNQTTEGFVWSFKTKSYSESGSSGSVPINKKPVADGSSGEPYQGVIDSAIIFDATNSYDEDGNIESYFWNFGDGITGNGKIVTHSYSSEGIYLVKLTVYDNRGGIDSYTTSVMITKPNLPPSIPLLIGPKVGNKDTDYSYTVTTTDLDNDDIQFILDWDDSTITSSEFLSNETIYRTSHNWTKAGVYSLKVTAYDNKTLSESAEINVLIDTKYVLNLGYLIDEIGDNTYENFYSNSTGEKTNTEKTNDGSYLLDSSNDGEWDYKYDITTGQLLPYGKDSSVHNENSIVTLVIIGILIFTILIVIIMFFLKRSNIGQN
jgi:parallel beta-helix repeat protein